MSRVITFPLSLVTSGQRVVLVGYEGNGRSNQRLAELGLTPETEIRVLQAVPGQPLVLKARGYRLAIDRKTAEKIRVRVCGGDSGFPCRRKRRGRWFGRHWRARRRWWRGRKQLGEEPLRINDTLRHSEDETD
jgi:Fe2+ transport system protein FeoA